MALNSNGPPTLILIQRAYLNGPQFKRALKNNINPEGPGPINLILPNQFKWFPVQ